MRLPFRSSWYNHYAAASLVVSCPFTLSMVRQTCHTGARLHRGGPCRPRGYIMSGGNPTSTDEGRPKCLLQYVTKLLISHQPKATSHPSSPQYPPMAEHWGPSYFTTNPLVNRHNAAPRGCETHIMSIPQIPLLSHRSLLVYSHPGVTRIVVGFARLPLLLPDAPNSHSTSGRHLTEVKVHEKRHSLVVGRIVASTQLSGPCRLHDPLPDPSIF